MLKNYVLTALRAISKRKGFTVLNVLGLSIGLASSLLILQYVKDEFSYDDFHDKHDRIYRVEFDAYRDSELVFKCATALGEQFVSWYPYQIKITFKLLFTGVSIVTILGILTISSQTWKAAASNPVKSLRYE